MNELHVAFGPRRRHEPADGEAQVQKQHARRAQKPRLFGDGGEDEVVFHVGDDVGHAAPDADAEQVAVGYGVERLHDLVALVERVGEGVEPDADARLHVPEHEVQPHGGHGGQSQPDDQIELLPRGGIEHDQEHEEQHERAAQVLLEHDDDHGQGPHEQERQQGADVRQAERPDAPREDREHLAVLRQVAGQEQHDGDLGDFAGLEGDDARNAQPDAAAVDLLADEGQHGRQQKDEACDHERVLVVGQPVDVAQQRQHHHHAHHAQEQPHDLAHGQVGSQARDERDADPRKRERQRQDGRVGAGRELAHRKVGQHERHENAQRHPEGVHGQGLAVVQRQHGERQHHQGSGHAQEDELDVAARHEDAPPCAPPDVPPPVDPPAEAAS